MDKEYSPLSFKGMSTSRDAPNPLRPYYIPPSIGLPADAPPTSNPNSSSRGNSKGLPLGSKADFRSSARDIFSDLDYETYLPERDGSSVADMAKRLLDQAIWNYTSVLLAQPFEVAKIVLQCNLAGSSSHASLQLAGQADGRREKSYFDGSHHDDFESDDESEEDAPSYFTPTAPYETPSSPHRIRRHKPPSRSLSATPTPSSRAASSPFSQHLLDLRKNGSLLEVLSQLWTREGAWGIWKGTNSTFVYSVLLKTIETWTRSLLSALLNLPDPSLLSVGATTTTGGLNILDSPNPMAGVAVAVAAAGIAGLVLAPIDMIRTRLILTPVTSTPRALLPSLRALPTWICPPSLIPITLLHSTIPPLLSTSAPLFLRSSLHIDPITTPTTSSISTFCLSLAELFAKLPLETVLRRGHVSLLADAHNTQRTRQKHTILPTTETRGGGEKFKTIVPVGPYKGVWGTMWFIVREEGQSVPVSQQVAASLTAAPSGRPDARRQPPRRGQGIHGLWRGWRVGFWGLVGIWGAAALGGSSEGAF